MAPFDSSAPPPRPGAAFVNSSNGRAKAGVSRRRFLEWLGAAGGSGAVYQGALALGLMPGAAQASPTPMPHLGTRQRSVVLLGGGLSSLMACLELERAGYSCTILEASHRIGGRNLTLRAGDLIDEMGYQRRVGFDDEPHLYFNAGPARIPAHHQLLLHYCRTLGVELEPFTNVNYNAWVHDEKAFGGRRIRYRHLVTEARGFITELAAKAGGEGAFDDAFNAEDLDSFMEFLRAYGDLNPDLLYRGSRRGGYRQPGLAAPTAGMLEPGELLPRLDFNEILKSDFWRFKMHFGEGEDQAAPLMQARGGMDMIVKAFERNIRSPVLTRALVQRIRVQDDGVEVVYQHGGAHHRLHADYCLNCIPMHLLPGVDNNFPERYVAALRSTRPAKLFKLAVQSNKRFWEDESIYGGISWTNQPIEQVWYPSHGAHLQNGILLAAYTWSREKAEGFARMTPEARYAAALDQMEKLHPNVRQHAGAYASVPWQRMNHHMGCGAGWTEEARKQHFSYLQEPLRGRHLLMGDQMSYHPGWQEGALSSAHHALVQLRAQVDAEGAGAERAS